MADIITILIREQLKNLAQIIILMLTLYIYVWVFFYKY